MPGGVAAEPRTVVLVRDFFEAIEDRDVDRALRLARAERPTGEAGRFLVPEALDDDWKVVAVTEKSDYDWNDYAEAAVVLEGEDRRRLERA